MPHLDLLVIVTAGIIIIDVIWEIFKRCGR